MIMEGGDEAGWLTPFPHIITECDQFVIQPSGSWPRPQVAFPLTPPCLGTPSSPYLASPSAPSP